LKCGILRNEQFTRSSFGVPQGLANIYYWLNEKRKLLNQSRTTQRNKKYKQAMQNLEKRSEEYKTLFKELNQYIRKEMYSD